MTTDIEGCPVGSHEVRRVPWFWWIRKRDIQERTMVASMGEGSFGHYVKQAAQKSYTTSALVS